VVRCVISVPKLTPEQRRLQSKLRKILGSRDAETVEHGCVILASLVDDPDLRCLVEAFESGGAKVTQHNAGGRSWSEAHPGQEIARRVRAPFRKQVALHVLAALGAFEDVTHLRVCGCRPLMRHRSWAYPCVYVEAGPGDFVVFPEKAPPWPPAKPHWKYKPCSVALVGLEASSILAATPNLQSLALDYVPQLFSQQSVPGLAHLEVNHCVGLKSLAEFSTLVGLESLQLYGCHGLLDLNGLSALNRLTHLTIQGVRMQSLGGLSEVPSLTHLVIHSFNVIDSAASINDLTALRSLPDLTQLTLSNLAVSELSSLAELSQLTHLEISGWSVVDLDALASLTRLTHLRLFRCGVAHVDALSALAGLRHLEIVDCRSLNSVRGLGGLSQLKSLTIYGCHRLATLSGVSGLSQLEHFILGQCRELQNVDDLADLGMLKELDMTPKKALCLTLQPKPRRMIMKTEDDISTYLDRVRIQRGRR